MDYSKDPIRSPELTVLGHEPFNAEAELSKLIEHAITPESLAYVRNHGPVPKCDPNAYQIVIDGLVKKELTFTCAELEEKFERVEVVATLQCAGNRRKVMDNIKRVNGIKWGEGILINANWSGYRLIDILLSAGLLEEMGKTLHVCFASEAPTTAEPWYGASVPLSMVMDPERSVLLATHMNGDILTADHGYPLRVIVPGTAGARWVKWVQRITVSNEESPNYYQQKDYRILPSHVDCAEKAEKAWSKYPPLDEMPINSAIAAVWASSQSPPSIKVKGYAVGDVHAVEVSVDKGKTIYQATSVYKQGPWSWLVWECTIPLDKEDGEGMKERELEVWSRASGKDGTKQPEECGWNYRGIAYNGIGKWEGKVLL